MQNLLKPVKTSTANTDPDSTISFVTMKDHHEGMCNSVVSKVNPKRTLQHISTVSKSVNAFMEAQVVQLTAIKHPDTCDTQLRLNWPFTQAGFQFARVSAVILHREHTST